MFLFFSRCIDIYEIVHLVGEGTYGEVFKSVLKSQMASFLDHPPETKEDGMDDKQNAINRSVELIFIIEIELTMSKIALSGQIRPLNAPGGPPVDGQKN